MFSLKPVGESLVASAELVVVDWQSAVPWLRPASLQSLPLSLPAVLLVRVCCHMAVFSEGHQSS